MSKQESVNAQIDFGSGSAADMHVDAANSGGIIMERKSVRAFEERPVPEEKKRMILQAAMEAPTAGNQQLYTILDITDQHIKERLAESCDHQPFIARAPMVLVFCADCLKWFDAYREAGCLAREPGAGDLMLAVTDTAIAAQNAVTAAWSMGIGSCYIGDIMEQCKTQRKILNSRRSVRNRNVLLWKILSVKIPIGERMEKPCAGCSGSVPESRAMRIG